MRGRLPKVKSYTGDGSNEVALDFGFKPKLVEIYNETDGTVFAKSILKDDGTTVTMLLADGGAATDVSKISSNAPAITSRGFRTGTNASLITNAKDYLVIAY